MEEFKNAILDIIFPRRCLGCGILISEPGTSYVCHTCLAQISLKKSFACAFCKSPVASGTTCHFCRPHHFLDKLFVATDYENPIVEKMLKTMKYRFVQTLAADIAGLLAKYLEKNKLLRPDSDKPVVVPVPLHRLRLNWRGFNQSEIMADHVSKCFSLEMEPHILKRVRSSVPQAEIENRNSRIENMKHVFTCVRPELVREKTVLLVDDVSTTGSTLDDCARALKTAGAKKVIGLVFARN